MSKTHCSAQNLGLGAQTADHWVRTPAVLDSWAGRPISAPLEHSQLIRDLAGGHRHELTENTRSDPGIFNFVKWLRVGEEACPTLEQAKARLKELYPSKPGWPDTTLVISQQAHGRRTAPEASKLLQLEVIHMGETQKGVAKPKTARRA